MLSFVEDSLNEFSERFKTNQQIIKGINHFPNRVRRAKLMDSARFWNSSSSS